MADTNRKALYVKTGDEASLRGALALRGLGNDAIKVLGVYPKAIRVEIPADQADEILKVASIEIDGTQVSVELSKPKAEKPAKLQMETPKAKPAAPAIPQGPVKVKPPVQRASPSPKADKPKGPEIRRAVVAPPPRKERRFSPELIDFVAGTYVTFFAELETEDLEKAERLIRHTDAGVEMAITSVKATLLGDIERGPNAEYKKESRENLRNFLGEVARLSKKPEKPLATIADGQQAKANDRGGKRDKAKGARNASPTAEAPAPVTPPPTESTPAAAQQ